LKIGCIKGVQLLSKSQCQAAKERFLHGILLCCRVQDLIRGHPIFAGRIRIWNRETGIQYSPDQEPGFNVEMKGTHFLAAFLLRLPKIWHVTL
jgi:hypothetical protein